MIDRMRLQGDDKSPRRQGERRRGEREQLLARVRAEMADRPEALAGLEAVLASVAVYSPAREQSKTNTIRILHEARMPIAELGRRFVERGLFESADDINMVREDELDAL